MLETMSAISAHDIVSATKFHLSCQTELQLQGRIESERLCSLLNEDTKRYLCVIILDLQMRF